MHLNSHIKNENGTTRPYYIKVDKFAIDNDKNQLNNLLQEAVDNSLTTKKESTAMNPDGKGAAKFYMTFKYTNNMNMEKHLQKDPFVVAVELCGKMSANL